MTTEAELAALVASIPATQRHVRAATRRKAELILRARDRREDELLDLLEAAEWRVSLTNPAESWWARCRAALAARRP